MLERDLLIRNCWSYLVAETLGCNDRNFIADSLVCLEIEGQLWIVSLNDDLGRLLHRFSADATHDCGLENLSSRVELSVRSFEVIKIHRFLVVRVLA